MKSNFYNTIACLKNGVRQLLQVTLMTALFSCLNYQTSFAQAGGPLTATTDPVCTSKCCEYSNPCKCSAGVIITGGVPPYSILVIQQGGSGPVGFTACVTGLCPGSYDFHIRDSKQPQPTDIVYTVTIGGPCCKLNCRDTAFCFNLPDSAIHLVKPTYTSSGSVAGGNGACFADSIWSNAPLVYPVGTTVVTWYALHNGMLDSCQSNVIRNPPSVYFTCFTTNPPIVGGVINICNGQSVYFNANCSSGITGLLWNFGNGYYSGNSVHTEPGSHYPPGTYYDTLTVYDDCGTPHDTAFQVVVDSSSGPDIYCLSVQCPGDTVTYHTHANCTGYTWSVTGGTFLFPPSATSDSCLIIWGAGPLGTITLTVTGCTPPLTCPLGTTVQVHIVPTTLPVRGDTVVCSGGKTCYSIECIPGNIHSWEMLPSNAGVITGANTCEVCIQWDTAFFGYVTLQVNYHNVLTGSGCSLDAGCVHDPGCGGSGTITIHVKPNFGIVGPSKVCPNAPASPPFNGMNLTNNTIAPGVAWKLETPVPSTINFGTTALLNAYTWNNGPGIYTLTAYPPLGIYCNDSAKVNVEVVDMKTPNPITGLDTVCAGDTTYYTTAPNMSGVTYTWAIVPPSAGNIIGPNGGSSVAVQWNAGGGTITVFQTLSASPFCTSPTVTYVVKTWPNFTMPAITPGAVNPCVKSTITYTIPPTLLSNATYTWSVQPTTAGNIITANGTNSITIHWIDASNTPIYVVLKINRCYEDSVKLLVNLQALPLVPNISYSPINPCKNTPVTFTTTSIQPTYYWTFGDGGNSSNQTQIYTYTVAGDYTVQLVVTNANGCSDTANTPIHIEDVPVVPVITGPVDVCVNAPSSHTFSQPLFMGASYTWSLSAPVKGGITSSGNNFINVLWSIPGTDTIKLHVQSTCLDTILKFVVTVHPTPTPGILIPSPACEGSPLTFNGSGGPSYSWSFTGGTPNSTIIAAPIVTYAVAGSYPLSLTVTDGFGCTATTNGNITVHPLPTALISGPSSVCAPYPKTVSYAAVNIGGYTYAWTPSGSGPSITQTINAQTTFSVIVTNSFGCTRMSNSITIDTITCNPDTGNCTPFDTINFTYTPPICLSQTYTKTGTATLTAWNFTTGSAGPISPVTNTYPYPGIYLVTVYGSSPGIDSSGNPCTVQVSHQKQLTIPFDARFEFSYQCNGSNQMTTVFNNTSLYLGSAASYNWTWYDVTTSTLLSTNPFPPPIIISPAGPHTINLYIYDPVTMATCITSHVINVPVPIVANFTVSTPVCQGSPSLFTDISVNVADEVSRLFNNGNAATSALSPANLVYINSGNFTATLNVTDKYGCTSNASQLITVNPQATGTITVTPGCDSVQLLSSGVGPYYWNIIIPPPPPTANPVYVYNSGFYSVTSVDGNGCPFTVGPVNVIVNKSPNATITGQTNYCQGENIDIKTSAAGTNFAWVQLPSTPVGGNTPNLTVLAGGGLPGTYTYKVTVTGLNGCTASATYTIIVDPVPASASIIGGPLTFCDGDTITLKVNPPGFTYLWSKSPAPPLSNAVNTLDSLNVTVSGTYSVIVYTANGCAYPAIAPVTVTVNPTPPANITGDTIVCEGETLVLTTTSVGGGTYAWSGPYGTGNTNPFIATNMQLSDAGIYTVVVTNSFGCTNSDTTTVIVNPTPANPIVAPPGPFCEGTLHQLCVQAPPYGPLSYLWNTQQNGYCINAVKAGDYFTVVTNQYGCSATSNIVSIHPLPDLSCVPTGCYDFCTECDTVFIPGPFNLTFYDWQKLIAGVWTTYANTQNLPVVPPGGIFRLIGYNQWGCSDSTDTLKIDFHDCCPPVDTISCIDTCLNFNDGNLSGWQPHPSAPNVGVTITNVLSQGGASDYFIQATDQPGPSQLLSGSQFNGHWCCGTFCFDYRMIDDGVAGSANVNPSFTIFNGTLGFRFISSTIANENNGWHRICAPISDCGFVGTSPSGTWAPITGTAIANWSTVISNVSALVFKVDYTAATNEISGFDNPCLTPDVPVINAGPDQTICHGGVAILHVTGCNSTPSWYEINGGMNFFIGNGGDIDVTPSVSTCYMVVCCNAGACCCDTDTICVIVNQLPVISWSTVYPSVCLNSAPVYLDPLNINATPSGGTGIFSGPFVTGNYFNPVSLGIYTITYCYTDTNGCVACVSNTITVIPCCDSTTCHVDAGPDQTICLGGFAFLHATGCDSVAHWYELTPKGPKPVGMGENIDVFPKRSTCYIVTCCCPGTNCCASDTVCITVLPKPRVIWSVTYPAVCLNSAPIYLDTLGIITTPSGGTGVFSGVGVIGYYFYPNTLGSYTISYCYTDTNGCIACAYNTINVIPCCTCSINAGNDTTICEGSFALLHVEGCDSVPRWYEFGPDGSFNFIGQGPSLDVFPQYSTCYAVICCCAGTGCCDTDTVCINVNPHPVLQWSWTYNTVCQYSDSIFLNANTVLVNTINGPVPITSTGGTWTWSGTGVVGNYFYPNTLGVQTITLCYTDTNGCTACISVSINVIYCCNTSCQVNAGNDTTICEGSSVILNAQGCNGSLTWYVLTGEGPIVIGIENGIPVYPQVSTCYIAICCCNDPNNPGVQCCDTDTICINVNPHPVLQWPWNYNTVCQYSDSIFLDANNVYVITNNGPVPITSTGGTWNWSGPGVVGNYFHPNTIGVQTITLCYTDPNGCTACISITINVIYCCNTSCQVNAGNDTTICSGSSVTLNAQGCNGSLTWYVLTGEGPIVIGLENGIPVYPQVNTCYIAICCCNDPNNPGVQCCDTDTICITMRPVPHLEWPYQYQDVCLNSDSIFLNPYNVFVDVNQTMVMLPYAGGTWTWSGNGVIGNYFYPNTLGPHVITICYTDIYGCTSCITKTINVIYCCGQSCQVDGGPDQNICLGNPAILNAQGCNGTATWYQITGVEQPTQVGQGGTVDVFPQQNTCYMVICCCTDPNNPAVVCCDTDTVCVIVRPALHLEWPLSYMDQCLNAAPVFLNPNNIFVDINQTMVSLPFAGGTWTFSGTGVFGNYFYPNTLGTHVITLTYIDPYGCIGTVTNTISVINCCDTVCQDYNNGQFNGWQPDPNAPNLGVAITNTGSQNGVQDHYLETTDQSGASALMASTDYNHWCCGEFCYDYRIFYDGDPSSSYNVNPIFWVYSGTLGFYFTSNIVANENNGWHRVCAPVSTCSVPDSSAAGVWKPITGTAVADWNTVSSNISRIVFRVDYSSFQGERSGIDNVCFTPTPLTVSLTAHCNQICATVNGCCGPFTYQWSGGTVAGNCITALNPNTLYTVTVTNQNGEVTTASIMSGPPVDDGNPCTIDACDPVTGDITHLPLHVDDGNPCTQDGCDPVSGVYHIPVNVNDGNACTIDGCDPVSGIYHTPVNVDDGNACTLDRCKPQSGLIIHTPISCNDNNACTLDGCDPATGCYHASLNPDDGNPCTIDGCDPVSGIYHNPAVEICGNGIDDDCDGLVDEGCISHPVLNVSVFIEGFYTGSGVMQPVLLNAGVGNDSSITDTILIVLHADTVPFDVDTAIAAILYIDGYSTVTLTPAHAGKSYYIAVLTRNGIETWSKLPVTIGAVTDYDFRIPEFAGPGAQNQLRINSINKNPINRRPKIIKP